MEKDFEITEDNYEAYKKLHGIKSFTLNSRNLEYYDKKTNILSDLLFYTGCIVSLILPLAIACTFFPNPTLLTGIFGNIAIWGVILGGFYLSYKLTNTYTKKRGMKLFKQDYPNLKYDINQEELKKELVKYEELSSLPKDIETKKEESLSNFSEKIKGMTTSEKIAYLEEQKEFWEQVKIQEKYQDKTIDLDKEKVKQK